MEKTTLCYIEENDRYLLLHRIKKENDANKDKWIGIGGHFEPDETPETCIRRETMEETGLTLTGLRFRGIVDFCSDLWPEEWMYLFSSDSFSGEEKECNEGELVWIEKERMKELNFWEGDYVFLAMMEDPSWPGIECRPSFDVTGTLDPNHLPAGCFFLRLSYEGDRLIEHTLL